MFSGCSIRAIWILNNLDAVVFSRRFPVVEKRWRSACKTNNENIDHVFSSLPSDSNLANAFVHKKLREGSARGLGIRKSNSTLGSDSWVDDPITRHIIGLYINKELEDDRNLLWPLILHIKGHYSVLVLPMVEPRHVKAYERLCKRPECGGSLGLDDSLSSLLLELPGITGRFGIGTKLVEHLEEWCKQKEAKYAYMATDCTNEPSINLFTKKCGYSKFRTLTMLVQPVHAHHKPISTNISVLRLPPRLAGATYSHIFTNSEFFPKDIDLILSNKLNLGTYMAIPRKYLNKCDPKKGIFPPSYAILSVWNTKEVFKLQVKGVSPFVHACCVGTRLLDKCLPWLRLPSFPNVFRPFGIYVMYGLHMEGKYGKQLMKSLCGFVHNMARDDGDCGTIVAEVSQRDPVKEAVPHWRKFSWAEDMWCIKNLEGMKKECGPFDYKSFSDVIFVDPRDF